MDFARYVLIVMACWFGVSLFAGTILGLVVDAPMLDVLGGVAALAGIVLGVRTANDDRRDRRERFENPGAHRATNGWITGS